MRNGRPASRPITNPFATTPSSLVTRRKCSSPGPSQGAHMTSRSTLDLRTLGSAICAYSVGGVGENHTTERCSCSAASGPQSLRYERPRSPEIGPRRERDQGAGPEAHREAGGAGGPRIGGVTKPDLNAKQFAPNLWALYLGRRERRIRESDMPPPAEMSGQHERVRQQSRAAWGAVARGWYAQREELWKASRPVSEWMVRRLDPQPGDTVLELADTGLMAARLVGESGRVIVTDFTPEMVAAAR